MSFIASLYSHPSALYIPLCKVTTLRSVRLQNYGGRRRRALWLLHWTQRTLIHGAKVYCVQLHTHVEWLVSHHHRLMMTVQSVDTGLIGYCHHGLYCFLPPSHLCLSHAHSVCLSPLTLLEFVLPSISSEKNPVNHLMDVLLLILPMFCLINCLSTSCLSTNCPFTFVVLILVRWLI